MIHKPIASKTTPGVAPGRIGYTEFSVPKWHEGSSWGRGRCNDRQRTGKPHCTQLTCIFLLATEVVGSARNSIYDQ